MYICISYEHVYYDDDDDDVDDADDDDDKSYTCPRVLRSDPRLHFLLLLPKSFLIQNGPSPCIYLPENSLV